MRVAVVAEIFLPAINGVTHTVMRVCEHLRQEGHEAIIIAPSYGGKVPKSYAGFPVITLPSWGLPGYQELRLTTAPQFQLEWIFEDFKPDVVHLAAPILLGYRAALAAARLHLPTVAIYQTDIPSFAASYGLLSNTNGLLWWRVRNTHSAATMTLAPSTAARKQLLDQGIPRVGLWGRGVDSTRFHPGKRDDALRARLAPNGEKLIGYVGRLAGEKRVDDLAVLRDIPGTRTVVIGDGPRNSELRAKLPNARFLGQLTGEELPRALASMDVFVHPGELETFCQSIQEALASGVPAVAPARGGPLDLIQPSHTGWLYQPGDLTGLRNSVVDLVGDDFKRQAFSRAARESVAHRTWDQMCATLVEHYQSAIATNQLARLGSYSQ